MRKQGGKIVKYEQRKLVENLKISKKILKKNMVAKLENLKILMEKQGCKVGKLEQRKQVENLKTSKI